MWLIFSRMNNRGSTVAFLISSTRYEFSKAIEERVNGDEQYAVMRKSISLISKAIKSSLKAKLDAA